MSYGNARTLEIGTGIGDGIALRTAATTEAAEATQDVPIDLQPSDWIRRQARLLRDEWRRQRYARLSGN